jgi:nitrogen fixation NifU-like protein
LARYSEELIDHYKNPRNLGEMEDADAVATVGNPVCGDVVTMFIKVRGEGIARATFQTYGCGPCVALSSMVTEKVAGMSLDNAYELTIQGFLDKYPEIPTNKRHCTNLVIVALRKAIDMYREKRNKLEDEL